VLPIPAADDHMAVAVAERMVRKRWAMEGKGGYTVAGES
jgi:hypothetical protein